MKTRRSTAGRSDPTRCVAYLRVSTNRERQELGMEAQAQAISSWARREGIEIVATFEEEVSGGASLEKRPILLQAIAALGVHGAGMLVVQRLDRFSRDPLTAAMAELEAAKFGAKIVSADGNGNGDDPGSRLMRDVGLAAARFERAMIAARTKAALSVKRTRGESTGTPPYGLRVAEDGKTLVPNEQEEETLRRLREYRARGWPYRQIRDEATRLGLLGRTGRPFTLQAVFEMTKDEATTNAGEHFQPHKPSAFSPRRWYSPAAARSGRTPGSGDPVEGTPSTGAASRVCEQLARHRARAPEFSADDLMNLRRRSGGAGALGRRGVRVDRRSHCAGERGRRLALRVSQRDGVGRVLTSRGT